MVVTAQRGSLSEMTVTPSADRGQKVKQTARATADTVDGELQRSFE